MKNRFFKGETSLPKIILFILLAGFSTNSQAQFSGVVLDAETRKPINGALVLIQSQPTDSILTATDSTGRFTLDTVPKSPIYIKNLGYEVHHFHPNLLLSNKIIFLSPLSIQLSEIKINASQLDKSSLEISSGFNRVSHKEIRQGKTISAPEFLSTLPGVYMQQGTYSTNKLTIRGIGARATYGTNRIKAYLDEIPLTNGDGVTTFEDIDPEFLSKVEILKGASSAAYGSGLGGTLRLYTLQPEMEGTHASVHSLAGSFGLFKNMLSAGIKNNDKALTAIFSNTYSGGYRQNNRYVHNNALLKSTAHWKTSELTLLAYYTGINSQIPSSLDRETFETHPTAAATNWLQVKGYEKYVKFLGGISLKTPLKYNLQNYATVFGNVYNGYELRPFNVLDDQSSQFGIRERLAWKKQNFQFTGGLEYFRERYQWRLYETVNGGQGNQFSDNSETRYYIQTFLLGTVNLSNHLMLDGGLGLHYFNYQITDKFNSGDENQSGNYANAPILSPRVGLVYKVTKTHAVYTAAGHGFSPPSTEEALLPEGNLNPNLKPEEGMTYELGIRGSFSRLNLHYDIGTYFSSVKNMLVTKRLSEADFLSINAGKSSLKGIEFIVKKHFLASQNFTFTAESSGTFSWNKFEDFTDDEINYSGNQLPGIPAYQLYFGQETRFKNQYFLSLKYSLFGSQYLNDANSAIYENFDHFDLKAGYQKTWKNQFSLRLNLGVDNLFNARYASMLLVNAPQFGTTSPRYFYPALPRNLYFSIQFSK